MNIVFIILKVIGILLLIILFLILLILFHPVFYKLKGQSEDTFSLEGTIWWMFKIFCLEFQIEDTGSKVQFKIFGFSKKEKESIQTDEEIAEELTEAAYRQAEQTSEKQDTEDVHVSRDDLNSRENQTGHTDQADSKQKEIEKPAKAQTKKPPGKHKNDKHGWFSVLKREISDEKNQAAVRKLFHELVYLLSKIKPSYCKADLSFATGDPAWTGEVTGVLSLIPVFYQKRMHLYPDFTSDEFYIRGDLIIKGHMALFHIVRSGIHILRDKNIKRLWHKIRR